MQEYFKRMCVKKRGVGKCVYPSFDVDGHKEPSEKHHYNQGLKHMTTGALKTPDIFPSLSQLLSAGHTETFSVSKVTNMFV